MNLRKGFKQSLFIALLGTAICGAMTPTFASTPSYLWYRFKPNDKLVRVLTQLKICGPTLSSCDQTIRQIRRLNPMEVSKTDYKVMVFSQLVLPIEQLPEGTSFVIGPKFEIMPPAAVAQNRVAAVAPPVPVQKPSPVSEPIAQRQPAAVQEISKQAPQSIPITDASENAEPTPPIEPAQPAPAVQPAAISVAKQTPPSDVEIPHTLRLSVKTGSTTLQAVDPESLAQSTLFSKHDIAIQATWTQQWTNSFSTFAGYTLRNITFQPSNNAQKSLTDISQTPQKISIGGKNQLTPRLRLGYSAAYGDELFVYGADSLTLKMERLAVPSATLDLRYRLYQKGQTEVGATAQGTYYGTATSDYYTVRAGSGFAVGGFLERSKKSGSALGLDLRYFQRQQPTSIFQINESGISLGASFRFSLFGNDE